MRSEARVTLRRCVWLAALAITLWGLLLFPAYRLGGGDGVEGLTLAALLCLVPGWLVFVFSTRFSTDNARLPFVVIGGSVLRIVFVLMGMFAIRHVREDLQFHEFILWLLVFYMGMLAAETGLMLKLRVEPQDVARGDRT